MPTSSFKKPFVLPAKVMPCLVDALNESKQIDIKPKVKAHFVTSNKQIHKMFDDILG